jgi:hypothetical protein
MSNFFVIGSKNVEFNKSGTDMNNSSMVSDPAVNLNKTKNTDENVANTSILFEKFYINNGDDLASQTLAYL